MRKNKFVGVIMGVLSLILLACIIQSFRMLFATEILAHRLAYSLAVVAFAFSGYFVALNIAYFVFGVDLEKKYSIIRRLNNMLRI